MTKKRKPKGQDANSSSGKPTTKKERIIALYLSGMDDISDIALITSSRSSYVGSVLRDAGLVKDYFDVFTSSQHPMNVYSKFFANKLGFRDEQTAHDSVRLIERLYRQFQVAKDHAGQHHALLMALTMLNRARWTKKEAEAEIYRRWLADRLDEMAFQGSVGRLASSDNKSRQAEDISGERHARS